MPTTATTATHCLPLQHLPNISAANPGKRINFVEHAAGGPGATPFWGQLAPYQGVWGCDLTSRAPWPATLFRFPLRTPALAERSKISKQVGEGE